MPLKISLVRQKSSVNLQASLDAVSSKVVYIGIPASATSSQRREALRKQDTKLTSSRKATQKRKQVIRNVLSKDVSNALLLYWFSKGTFRQPARPVIEPALRAPGTKERIAAGLAKAVELTLEGKNYQAKRELQKVANLGKKASKDWFLDPRNDWPPNAAKTIAAKGFDLPGIATRAMMEAIDGWVE